MSRIGEVLSTERVVEDGAYGVDVKFDPGGGANATAPHFADPGDDSLPLPGDFLALEDSVGAGAEQATGYADTRNAGKARPGEKRIYARDASGAVVVDLWLQRDGSIVISNGAGSFTMKKTGAVEINGVVIGVDGSISAKGEVTANASTPLPIKLSAHTHLTAGTGTPSKPVPFPPTP